jgi:HEAT repeat protein
MDGRYLLLTFWLTFSQGWATAQSAETEKPFRGKTFAEWRAHLKHPEAKMRSRAATALGLGPFGKSAVDPLLETLQDSNEDVRAAALTALENIGPTAAHAIPHLLALSQHGERSESASARYTLARFGPAAVPCLLNLEEGSLVGRVMGKSALPALLSALRDERAAIREQALLGLVQLGPHAVQALPALVSALGDSECVHREAVLGCLYQIGPRAAAAAPAVARLLADEKLGFAAANTLTRMGNDGFTLLRQACRADNQAIRYRAVSCIGRMGAESLPLVLSALCDPDVETRRAAADGLWECGLALDDALPQLLQAMNDPNENVRAIICQTLAQLTHSRQQIVRTLGKAFLDESSPVREAADWALAQLFLGHRDSAAVPFLLSALRDPREGVRFRAIHRLPITVPVDSEVVLALCRAVHDKDSDVRKAALLRLGNLGAADRQNADQRRSQSSGSSSLLAASEVQVAPIEKALRHSLADPDADLRIEAIRALGRIGYRPEEVRLRLAVEVLDPSHWFCKSVLSTFHRCRAAEALGEMGPVAGPVVPLLILGLWDDSPEVHLAVLKTLAAIGPAARGALPRLRQLVFQPSVVVGRTPRGWTFERSTNRAVLALLALEEPGRATVREALRTKDLKVRQDVLKALTQAGTSARDLIPDLLLAMDDVQLREEGISALQALGARCARTREVLVLALQDASSNVRSQACRMLGDCGPPGQDAIPALCELLLDSSPGIRSEALTALKKIGPDVKVALPALLETMTDPSAEVRQTAAEALGAMGAAARPALPALRADCRDADDSVKMAAAVALVSVGRFKDEATRVLEAVLRDGTDASRIEAALALWRLHQRPDVVPPLVRLLEDDRFRSEASKALRSLDGAQDDVAAFVRPLLRHPKRAVRLAAREILANRTPVPVAGR